MLRQCIISTEHAKRYMESGDGRQSVKHLYPIGINPFSAKLTVNISTHLMH